MVEATERITVLETATAEEIQARESLVTLHPTWTPVPSCLDFVVIVPSALVRELPSTASAILDSLPEGETVCVLGRDSDPDWYVIDRNPSTTRRIEIGYMFHNIIEAVNPTLTPTSTFTLGPTVTPLPTITPTLSPTPTPTFTPDPNATRTPAPTLPELPTVPVQGA